MASCTCDDAAFRREVVAPARRHVCRARVCQVTGEDEAEVGGVWAAARRREVDIDRRVDGEDGPCGGRKQRLDERCGHLGVGKRRERIGRGRRAFERRVRRLGCGRAGEG